MNAKEIRETLKNEFPKVKFQVKTVTKDNTIDVYYSYAGLKAFEIKSKIKSTYYVFVQNNGYMN